MGRGCFASRRTGDSGVRALLRERSRGAHPRRCRTGASATDARCSSGAKVHRGVQWGVPGGRWWFTTSRSAVRPGAGFGILSRRAREHARGDPRRGEAGGGARADAAARPTRVAAAGLRFTRAPSAVSRARSDASAAIRTVSRAQRRRAGEPSSRRPGERGDEGDADEGVSGAQDGVLGRPKRSGSAAAVAITAILRQAPRHAGFTPSRVPRTGC
ncbi:hypothetical protein STRTUCAR8_08084 [Streptomyces turgidiscabies Car8]|uniref:Uncharacterized protein n=1 Tax=Streptomyces turgidiscabies (strain Car8) TaxID=698760 RepID=L7FGZ5_STRT8|nr:hypothetical protein STRTUCAR8_08084 [Streptomyces turgidiscabies Car8]